MSAAPTVVPTRPLRVGSYELIESFLTSGPSTFYRAKNLILGNPVIVRRLTLDPARPEDARETFFREMRHAASLDHRAISNVAFDELDPSHVIAELGVRATEIVIEHAHSAPGVDQRLDQVGAEEP